MTACAGRWKLEAARPVGCPMTLFTFPSNQNSELRIQHWSDPPAVEKSDQFSLLIPNFLSEKIARTSPAAVKVNFSVFERRVSTQWY